REAAPQSAEAYVIPRAPLSGLKVRTEFRLVSEADLFGGWVPEAWMATKAIMHPLISTTATAPTGWMPALADAAIPLTLKGFAAFSLDDALEAGKRLLSHGAIRIKCANADGGQGQFVASDETELANAL